jgi:hypothetical protein
MTDLRFSPLEDGLPEISYSPDFDLSQMQAGLRAMRRALEAIGEAETVFGSNGEPVNVPGLWDCMQDGAELEPSLAMWVDRYAHAVDAMRQAQGKEGG